MSSTVAFSAVITGKHSMCVGEAHNEWQKQHINERHGGQKRMNGPSWSGV